MNRVAFGYQTMAWQILLMCAIHWLKEQLSKVSCTYTHFTCTTQSEPIKQLGVKNVMTFVR